MANPIKESSKLPPPHHQELDDADLDAILEAALNEMPPSPMTTTATKNEVEVKEMDSPGITPEMAHLGEQMKALMSDIPQDGTQEEMMQALLGKVASDPVNFAKMAQEMMTHMTEGHLEMFDPVSQLMKASLAAYEVDQGLCRGILAQKLVPSRMVFHDAFKDKPPFYFLITDPQTFQMALLSASQDQMGVKDDSRSDEEVLEAVIGELCRRRDAEKLTQEEAIHRSKGEFPLVRSPDPIEENQEMIDKLGVTKEHLVRSMLHDPGLELEIELAKIGVCLKNPDFRDPLLKAQRSLQAQVMSLISSGMSESNLQRHLRMQEERVFREVFGAQWGAFKQARLECFEANYEARITG